MALLSGTILAFDPEIAKIRLLMKKQESISAWFLMFFLISASANGAQKELLARLSDEHRLWLQREVNYIITERERDIFLSLATLEERNGFINSFWRRRDPSRASPTNEFKEEHYRRIEYANKMLGRGTHIDGWRTDRGRYYIILGEPQNLERFSAHPDFHNSELWTYNGDTRKGLPPFFYLLFFQKNDVGQLKLYHPILDTPEALIRGRTNLPGTANVSALEQLETLSPEVAHASLTHDASENPDFLGGTPSLGANIILARIEESPKRLLRTDWAAAWKDYGNRVAAEYSFNYVPNRHLFAVMVGPESMPFVHYSIEIDPESFGLETDEDGSKFYTMLDVTFEAIDSESKLIFSNTNSAYVELTPEQVQRVQRAPFAYQNDIPLLPGRYTLTVILRNRATTTYTVAEAKVEVPSFTPGTPALSDVILYHNANIVHQSIDASEIRTFQLGGLRLEPASDHLFAIGDSIHAFIQSYETTPGYKVKFELLNENQVFDSAEKDVGKVMAGGVTADLTSFGMPGGNYQVRVGLLNPEGLRVAEQVVPIVLSPRTAVPRPGFIFRRAFDTKIPGLLSLTRGDQLQNVGRHEEARAYYEKAVALDNPELPQARWKLASSYLRTQDGARALSLLAPLEQSHASRFEVVAGLGFSHYFQRNFAQAMEFLEKAITIRPPDAKLLNVLADCHQRQGNSNKAKAYFNQSLELNPNQDVVKTRLAELSSPSY